MVESLQQNWWYQLPGAVAPIHDKDEDPLDDAIFHITVLYFRRHLLGTSLTVSDRANIKYKTGIAGRLIQKYGIIEFLKKMKN